MRRLILWVCLVCAACNLSTTPPTPTAPPTATESPLILATLDMPTTPPPTTDGTCPNTPLGWVSYIIAPGDTLGLLALQTDSTVEEIIAGNCLDNPERIISGTVINLPRVPVVATPTR